MAIEFLDIYQPISEEALSNVPESMKVAARWIVWGGSKVPMNGNARNKAGFIIGADITNPKAWMSFEAAVALIGAECYLKREDIYFHVVGIGFIVGDGWFCLDYDGGEGHHREDVPRDDVLLAVNTLKTYAETSLSGAGYHVFGSGFVLGNGDPEKCHPHFPQADSYEIEFFTRRKFLIFSGNKLPEAPTDAADCAVTAAEYRDDVLRPIWHKEEEAHKAERQAVHNSIPLDLDDAVQMFLLNYEDILRFADIDEFKRDTKESGGYSWIGALKGMRDIGVPFSAALAWCERGSSFKSEKDVAHVWNEQRGGKKCSVAAIVKSAKAHGWKPDPDKLTGDYKKNHDEKVQREKDLDQFSAAVEKWTESKRYTDSLTETFGEESVDTVTTVIDPETGEVIRETPVPDPVESEDNEAAEWKTIETLPALPDFPLDVLPDWLQRYIINYHENTGVSKDFCAACILGAISTAVNGHLTIHFNTTHYEAAQLYILFIGRSGTMKSSTLSEFYRPITTWLTEKNDSVRSHNQLIMKEIAQLEEKQKNAGRKKENTEGIESQIEEKKAELRLEYPIRYTDVTPEALARRMAVAGGCATLASTEGNLIHLLTGKNGSQKGNMPNLDVFLQGADGEPVVISRVTTGDTVIHHANLSVLLAAQPDLLEELSKNKEAVGRGLVPRFLVFAPEQEFTFIDHTQPGTTDRRLYYQWSDCIKQIAERFMHPGEKPIAMELDIFSERDINELWNYTDSIVDTYSENSIRSWISKMRGKALRLAAIFAVLENPQTGKISAIETGKAIRLLREYFFPHYMRVYEKEIMLSEQERAIIDWSKRFCLRESTDHFKQTNLSNYIRQLKAFKDEPASRLNSRLEKLCEKGYIRPFRSADSNAKQWQINPEILK